MGWMGDCSVGVCEFVRKREEKQREREREAGEADSVWYACMKTRKEEGQFGNTKT